MARIDDLITQIADKGIRQKLEAALADMKRRQRFGLVFEEHIPETSTLLRFPVVAGATVQLAVVLGFQYENSPEILLYSSAARW